MTSLLLLLWIQVLVCVEPGGSTPPKAKCAYWIFPWFYGVCHCIAAVQPMIEEVIFPADFHADHFDDPELQQLAKALPAVMVCDCSATTVATYLRAYKSWRSWASRHNAAFCQLILLFSCSTSCLSFNRPSQCLQWILQCTMWAGFIKRVVIRSGGSIW